MKVGELSNMEKEPFGLPLPEEDLALEDMTTPGIREREQRRADGPCPYRVCPSIFILRPVGRKRKSRVRLRGCEAKTKQTPPPNPLPEAERGSRTASPVSGVRRC